MAQTALHAYIAIFFNKKLSYREWFFPAFLIGSILPDIDYLFSKLDEFIHIPTQLAILNKTFAHSLLTTVLIYLSLLIAYELKKNKKILSVTNGITCGILLHIFIDLLILFKPLDIFWPLPLNSIQIWIFNIPNYV